MQGSRLSTATQHHRLREGCQRNGERRRWVLLQPDADRAGQRSIRRLEGVVTYMLHFIQSGSQPAHLPQSAQPCTAAGLKSGPARALSTLTGRPLSMCTALEMSRIQALLQSLISIAARKCPSRLQMNVWLNGRLTEPRQAISMQANGSNVWRCWQCRSPAQVMSSSRDRTCIPPQRDPCACSFSENKVHSFNDDVCRLRFKEMITR